MSIFDNLRAQFQKQRADVQTKDAKASQYLDKIEERTQNWERIHQQTDQTVLPTLSELQTAQQESLNKPDLTELRNERDETRRLGRKYQVQRARGVFGQLSRGNGGDN